MKQDEIKNRLIDLLTQDNPDMSAVLELASDFAKTDKGNVRFSVDAGIINRLGKELVGKPETAVSELVKNAYDADAIHADIIFKDATSAGGTLIIEDDGNGMDMESMVDGFMRLSSADKIHNPHSPVYGRIRAGRKGIGRFSAQRLGGKLTIISQTIKDDFAIKAIIDWSSFDTDKDLQTIANKIEYVPKIREKGTTLIIEHLHEAWGDGLLNRIYRSLSSLLQPEALTRNEIEIKTQNQDPGFKFTICRDNRDNKIADEKNQYLDYALAVIEGYVDESGQGYWRVTCKKYGEDNENYIKIGSVSSDDESKYEQLHDIRFKASYFVYDANELPKTINNYIKKLGNEIGGIRIYRNGFRVPPFGDRGNDWLGLDASVRRKTYVFPHQNQSFFGFVEITSNVSDLFEEMSNREGLIENEAYEELRDFVYRALTTACGRVASLRGRKVTANQKDWKQNPLNQLKEKLDGLQAMVDDSRNGGEEKRDKQGDEERERFKEAFEDIHKLVEEQESEKQKLIDENNMLRVIAGLGLYIGEFIHEIKNYIPGFNGDINFLKAMLKSYPELLCRVESLSVNIESFLSYISYFDETISRNVVRKLEPINLKQRVNMFLDITEANRNRAGIWADSNIKEREVRMLNLKTIPMHPSEWASILFNLYSNSKKAIHKAKPMEGGKIYVACGKASGNVFLEFSDNGTGIEESIRNRIFDAFFTTTSASARGSSDIESNTSMGLGLKIISDILKSYNGSIALVEPREGYKTTFRIEIPQYNG